ncbi:Z-ring formation inhibitor MciZ [Kroppenstedtia pulmonis]|uniref:Z-ring formation inhibitor MciZ n=2 Tax=Kroppenstedtia pulmonis TaxID=1380685 RepID=A0A7D4BVS6_9BACL|nr:Z-ring formation inhibitor MciZ [Kroppenstedtia pulmonis]
MRTEAGPKQLRMVGKGWQIRAALRSLARHPLTLEEWLKRQQRGRMIPTNRGRNPYF